MSFIQTIRALHIAAGSVSLLALCVPFATRKGGPAHRRFGWVFVVSISVVAATALAAAVYRLSTPSPEPVRQAAVFLGYLSLLSANSARTGIRVLQFKARTTGHREPVDLVLPGALLSGGAALSVWGQLTGFRLAFAFGIVGVIVAARQLKYWLAAPASPLHWKYQHMQSMVGACIAAVTAFLVVNARSFGVPERFSMLVWLGPTLVGLPGVLLWIRQLRKRETGETREPLAA